MCPSSEVEPFLFRMSEPLRYIPALIFFSRSMRTKFLYPFVCPSFCSEYASAFASVSTTTNFFMDLVSFSLMLIPFREGITEEQPMPPFS